MLVCEHLALQTLRENEIDASETEILLLGSRAYLEAKRFDRVGAHGRRGLVSLFALDAAYYGRFDSWNAAADRLERDKWLTGDDARALRLRWWFGRLIGNTDLHFGNVSFVLDHKRPLELAPVYDMLPMHYRPTPTGEVLTHEFSPPLPVPAELSTWNSAADLALLFWDRSSEDTRISTPFRTEAKRVSTTLRALRERYA